MDRSTPSNVIEPSTKPTVASVLGVKGTFHFHPHGSTQKAHVVLRQVEISEDPEEESESSMVYFSLFAQKRIEVKPGKEILLAVAAPDGRVLETPVILAAKVAASPPPSELKPVAPPSRKEIITMTKEEAMPPKMRKTWSKRFEASDTSGPISHSYIEVSVQTEPTSTESVETVRANGVDTTAATRSDPQESKVSSRRERSLSPMELDSPSSSPALSPVIPPVLPSPQRLQTKSASFSPPGLWISTSPQQPAVVAERQITPLHLSPDSGDPPGLSIFPPSQQPANVSSSATAPADSEAIQQEKIGTPASTISDNSHTIVASPPTKQPSTTEEFSKPATPTPEPTAGAPPYVPKRKTVPNPFVSGGLLTDFVGASSSQKGAEVLGSQGANSDGHDAKAQSKSLSPPPRSASPPPGLDSASRDATVEVVNYAHLAIAPVPATTPVPQTPVRPKTPPPISQPSSASSSKVKVEDVLPPTSAPPASAPAHTPAQPPPPPPIVSSLMSMFVPASTSQPPPPPPQSLPPPPAETRRQWTRFSKSNTPPPETRELAHVPVPVPTPSFSNPLGIRPSNNFAWGPNRHPLPNPPPPPLQAGPPKKPVAIGTGWPYNRQTNGTNGRRGSFKRAQNGLPAPPAAFPPFPPHFLPSGSMSPIAVPMAGPDERTDARSASAESDKLPSPGTATWGVADGSPQPTHTADTDATNQETRSPSVPTPLSGRSPIVSRFDIAPSGYHTPPLPPPPIPGSAPHTPLVPTPPIPSIPPLGSLPSIPVALPSASKPLAFPAQPGDAYDPRQGISLKRAGSPVPPAQAPEARRAKNWKWPVADGVYANRVKGEGDVGVRSIVHSSEGTGLAVICYDKSVRIWNNKARVEVAKLAHNMPVIAAAWMDRDAGIITLGDNGLVSTWTRSAGNQWQWAKILDASGDRKGEDAPCCLAFWRDRIAIAYPKTGVKVWLFIKGTWFPQRSILRQNVTVIKFVEDGAALLGGTTDGVLWYCEVPNGTLRAYSFMKAKISGLDVDPKGTHALAAQTGGRAHLVNITADDAMKGQVQQVYATSDPELQGDLSYDFGALFTSGGASLLFGCARGCVLAWDRAKAEVAYGLQHVEDGPVQAVACFDRTHTTEAHIVTGTRQGLLTWFSPPPVEQK